MIEEKYLDICISPSELSPNIKNFITMKLREKYLYKEIGGKMIIDMEINNFYNIPLSRSNINSIEISIPVKVDYKIYRPGDIIIGEIFTDGIDKRVFVISNDVICEIVNIDIIDNIQTKTVSVVLTNIKSTSGCNYFLSEGMIIYDQS